MFREYIGKETLIFVYTFENSQGKEHLDLYGAVTELLHK